MTPQAKPRASIGPATAVMDRRTVITKPPQSATVPGYAEYLKHFPVGFYLGPGQITVRDPGASTTTLVDFSNTGGWRTMDQSDVGLRRLGMLHSYWTGGDLVTMEDAVGLYAFLDGFKQIRVHAGIDGRTGAAGTGLAAEWFENPSNTNPTLAAAVTLAAPIVANLQDHPSILGYKIRDDVGNADQPDGTNRGAQAMIMMQAIQSLDPFGRPCSFVSNDTAVWARNPGALKVVNFYRYPCGRLYKASNVPPFTNTAEGDFHRGSFGPPVGGTRDFSDELRERVDAVPSSVRCYTELQTHSTEAYDNEQGTLRRPTVREYRAQFWIAIGENVKGIFWFTYDGTVAGPAPDVGVGDSTRSSELVVIKELNDRLTEKIRAVLLRCDRPATQPFTAAGGGRSDIPVPYTNAYISTLQDVDGTEYVVVCNRALSTQPVTINAATRTGWLESLETGVRIRVGGSVSLGALDGTILRHVPLVGVPKIDPDLSLRVNTWWSTHPFNPSAPGYIDSGVLGTHPTIIDVANGQSLQAAIDSNPGDNLSFRLAAGATFNETVHIVGRNGIHIYSANPANKATVRRIYLYGDRRIIWYNGGLDAVPIGFPALLESIPRSDSRFDPAIYVWENPKRDFILRDLKFTSDGIPIEYEWYRMTANGGASMFWTHNHWASGMPLWMRNVRDVLVERCEFSGYQQASDQASNTSVPDRESNLTDPISQFHSGHVGGNAGMTNILVRDNVFTPPNDTRGYPFGVFLDGSRGCIVEGNTFAAGKWQSGHVLLLTNDDFSFDALYDGRYDQDHETRNARYAVIANNITQGPSPTFVAATGQDLLITGNSLDLTGSTVGRIAHFPARCARHDLDGHIYFNYHSIVENNIITGNVIAFVETQPDDGWTGCTSCGFLPGGVCGTSGAPNAGANLNPNRGRVGQVTVTGNTITGTITRWLREVVDPVQSNTMDGPNVISGNNKNDSTGVGI